MSDLEKRTLVELRKMAKELGIPAISGLKKRELIEKIEQSSEVQKNDSVPPIFHPCNAPAARRKSTSDNFIRYKGTPNAPNISGFILL